MQHWIRMIVACGIGWVAAATLAEWGGVRPALAQPTADGSPAHGVASDPQVKMLRRSHPWGNFAPGAWKKVRVRSEMLDEAGNVTSSSLRETKTTLTDVTDDNVVLTIEMTVEVAGKRFDQQPLVVKQGFYGQIGEEQATLKEKEPRTIALDGEQLACEVRRVEIVNEGVKRTTEFTICADRSPHLIKRFTTSTSADNKPLYTTQVETIALDMPFQVLTELKTAAVVKTTHRDQQAVSYTLEVFCPEVPGGVVSHSSKETDLNGKVIRRTALELIDYALPSATAP